MTVTNDNKWHCLSVSHAQWHAPCWHIARGLSVISKTVEVQVTEVFFFFFFLHNSLYIYDISCSSSYFVYPQDIFDRPCLSNSYDLGQLSFLHSRCPPPPRDSFSFRSSNGICGKSPYVSNIAGPLCSSGITFSHYLLLRSLVPEVEVTRTVTQSQSDKMHNRRCGRELGSSGKASTKKNNWSACDRVLRLGFGAVHNLHSTVYWLNLYTPWEGVLSIVTVGWILVLSSAF